jgi:hypothetical protein
VQSDIARKLLKLRVSFQENTAAVPDVAYFVDFKLTEVNSGHVILLQGEKNSNPTAGDWLGHSGIKANHLNSLQKPNKQNLLKVHTIKVDEWRALQENEKLALLFSLTKQE